MIGFMRSRLQSLSAALFCVMLGWSLSVYRVAEAAPVGGPAWWSAPGTTIWETGPQADSFESTSIVTIGQLKYVAMKAKHYLDAVLASVGGAGEAVDAVFEFEDLPEANDGVANLGQVKAVAAPFYDRLDRVGHNVRDGYPATFQAGVNYDASPPYYPWLSSTPVNDNFKVLLVGQLKMVFSFDLSGLDTTTDTDGDGFTDFYEAYLQGDPTISLPPTITPQTLWEENNPDLPYDDPAADADGDGLTKAEEDALGTSHIVRDHDGDGLPDGLEVELGTNPLVADTDGDSLNDYAERVSGTDPRLVDTDGDTLQDNVETNTGTYVGVTDTGTDPLNDDTDEDGLIDGIEQTGFATDPTNPDSDNDGVEDSQDAFPNDNSMRWARTSEHYVVSEIPGWNESTHGTPILVGDSGVVVFANRYVWHPGQTGGMQQLLPPPNASGMGSAPEYGTQDQGTFNWLQAYSADPVDVDRDGRVLGDLGTGHGHRGCIWYPTSTSSTNVSISTIVGVRPVNFSPGLYESVAPADFKYVKAGAFGLLGSILGTYSNDANDEASCETRRWFLNAVPAAVYPGSPLSGSPLIGKVVSADRRDNVLYVERGGMDKAMVLNFAQGSPEQLPTLDSSAPTGIQTIDYTLTVPGATPDQEDVALLKSTVVASRLNSAWVRHETGGAWQRMLFGGVGGVGGVDLGGIEVSADGIILDGSDLLINGQRRAISDPTGTANVIDQTLHSEIQGHDVNGSAMSDLGNIAAYSETAAGPQKALLLTPIEILSSDRLLAGSIDLSAFGEDVGLIFRTQGDTNQNNWYQCDNLYSATPGCHIYDSEADMIAESEGDEWVEALHQNTWVPLETQNAPPAKFTQDVVLYKDETNANKLHFSTLFGDLNTIEIVVTKGGSEFGKAVYQMTANTEMESFLVHIDRRIDNRVMPSADPALDPYNDSNGLLIGTRPGTIEYPGYSIPEGIEDTASNLIVSINSDDDDQDGTADKDFAGIEAGDDDIATITLKHPEDAVDGTLTLDWSNHTKIRVYEPDAQTELTLSGANNDEAIVIDLADLQGVWTELESGAITLYVEGLSEATTVTFTVAHDDAGGTSVEADAVSMKINDPLVAWLEPFRIEGLDPKEAESLLASGAIQRVSDAWGDPDFYVGEAADLQLAPIGLWSWAKKNLTARAAGKFVRGMAKKIGKAVKAGVEFVKVPIAYSKGFVDGAWDGIKGDVEGVVELLQFIKKPVESCRAIYNGIGSFLQMTGEQKKQMLKTMLSEFLTKSEQALPWEYDGSNLADRLALVAYIGGYTIGFIAEQVLVSVLSGAAIAKIGTALKTIINASKTASAFAAKVTTPINAARKLQGSLNRWLTKKVTDNAAVRKIKETIGRSAKSTCFAYIDPFTGEKWILCLALNPCGLDVISDFLETVDPTTMNGRKLAAQWLHFVEQHKFKLMSDCVNDANEFIGRYGTFLANNPDRFRTFQKMRADFVAEDFMSRFDAGLVVNGLLDEDAFDLMHQQLWSGNNFLSAGAFHDLYGTTYLAAKGIPGPLKGKWFRPGEKLKNPDTNREFGYRVADHYHNNKIYEFNTTPWAQMAIDDFAAAQRKAAHKLQQLKMDIAIKRKSKPGFPDDPAINVEKAVWVMEDLPPDSDPWRGLRARLLQAELDEDIEIDTSVPLPPQ